MTEGTPLRVLWLSNALIEPVDRGVTGTWLQAMAQGLVDSGSVTLGNITTAKVSSLTTSRSHASVRQWVAPVATKLNANGLPQRKVVAAYLEVIDEFNPDLIHVWGAETFPGLLTARGLVKGVTLLEIQGLKGPLAPFGHGGLRLSEQIRSVGIKEIVRRSSIPQERAFFRRWGVFEREIMSRHRFIGAPSPWMAAHALAANPGAMLFQNEIPLRKEFAKCEPWQFTGAPIMFASSSNPAAYKGLHIVIRAAAILRSWFPHLQIRIAGAHQADGLRLSGYIRWLNGEIRRAGLERNVHWLGSIDAERLCSELQQCSVAVFPSFAESYGVALAEAMVVGTPAVCAFNGGSAYLAESGKTALFFPAGDEAVCAHQVRKLLESQSLSESLSRAARQVAVRRHDLGTIIERQIQIYGDVLRESRART